MSTKNKEQTQNLVPQKLKKSKKNSEFKNEKTSNRRNPVPTHSKRE